MKFNYNKLWKLLIDRGMTKTDLRIQSGISSYSLAKLGKGEKVTNLVLQKICNALGCQVNEIMITRDLSNIRKNRVN